MAKWAVTYRLDDGTVRDEVVEAASWGHAGWKVAQDLGTIGYTGATLINVTRQCSAEPPQCCGHPMDNADVFGVRIWRCIYRYHHPEVIENLQTGETIKGLTWNQWEEAE